MAPSLGENKHTGFLEAKICLSVNQFTDYGWQGAGEGGKDWEFGVSRRKLVYIGWINKTIYRTAQGTYSISCDKP